MSCISHLCITPAQLDLVANDDVMVITLLLILEPKHDERLFALGAYAA
jgi:hypothetical protein